MAEEEEEEEEEAEGIGIEEEMMDEVETGMIIGEETRREEDREGEGTMIGRENGRGARGEVTEGIIEMIEETVEIGTGIEGGREFMKREMNSESIFFACSYPHRERRSSYSSSGACRRENAVELAPLRTNGEEDCVKSRKTIDCE